jgi:hypothetical protein
LCLCVICVICGSEAFSSADLEPFYLCQLFQLSLAIFMALPSVTISIVPVAGFLSEVVAVKSSV